MNFVEKYIDESITILKSIDPASIDRVAYSIADVRNSGGRLFILGVGGSAATASHAVNDFRKIAHVEAYAPTDNVAEITARTNDNGWDTTFVDWLKTSRLTSKDAVMILSVGGGSRQASPNIVEAIKYARKPFGY